MGSCHRNVDATIKFFMKSVRDIFFQAAFQVIHQSAGFIKSYLVQPVFPDIEKYFGFVESAKS